MANTHHRSWRFNTVLSTYKAAYNEQWEEIDRGRQFKLIQAALTIYKPDRVTFGEAEIIGIHCEPENRDNGVRYKVGPHLHVKGAPEPVDEAHIALCPLNVQDAVSSVFRLSSIFAELCIMIREEMFKKTWAGPDAETLATLL